MLTPTLCSLGTSLNRLVPCGSGRLIKNFWFLAVENSYAAQGPETVGRRPDCRARAATGEWVSSSWICRYAPSPTRIAPVGFLRGWHKRALGPPVTDSAAGIAPSIRPGSCANPAADTQGVSGAQNQKCVRMSLRDFHAPLQTHKSTVILALAQVDFSQERVERPKSGCKSISLPALLGGIFKLTSKHSALRETPLDGS